MDSFELDGVKMFWKYFFGKSLRRGRLILSIFSMSSNVFVCRAPKIFHKFIMKIT
jgi:hypothetical protein